MLKLLIVGLGGFFGAIARYGLSSWVQRRYPTAFPIGTLAVNMLGCFLIGFLMHLITTRTWITPQMRFLLVVGFLGSLTTFSTFGYETLTLLEKGDWRLAMGNMLLNMTLGLIAVFAGRVTGRFLA